MSNNQDKKVTTNLQIFSKDNPIIEISSKQEQIKIQNVTPPARPKESKKK